MASTEHLCKTFWTYLRCQVSLLVGQLWHNVQMECNRMLDIATTCSHLVTSKVRQGSASQQVHASLYAQAGRQTIDPRVNLL